MPLFAGIVLVLILVASVLVLVLEATVLETSLQYCSSKIKSKQRQEIRSVERGICPTAALNMTN